MAQIDASIPLGIRPVQVPDQMNALAKMMQVQGLQQQNKLAQFQMEGLQRDRDDQAALRNALSAPDADPYKVLLGRGKVKEATEFAASKRTAEKDQIEMGLKKIGLGAQILSTAKDQASYDAARATAQSYGLDVSRMPPQFDPAFVQSKLQESLTMKDQLEQKWKALDHTLKVDQFGETRRHNATTEGLTASGQSLTRRGQDMTDSRARDFNAVQQDANNIKRSEKKEVQDLTKNSQVASFDTMLGTLDRLATHSGLKRSVGMTGAFPTMPGSDSANFQAELNTFQSQAFLPMVAQLKGMGALSDAEGKKLTAAVGALDPKMGEEAFRASVARITEDMEQARERVAGARRTPTKPNQSDSTSPKRIANDSDYNALPSGAEFIGPDGKKRRKP